MRGRSAYTGILLVGLLVAGCTTTPAPPIVAPKPEKAQDKPKPVPLKVVVEPEPEPESERTSEKPAAIPPTSDLEHALKYFNFLRNASVHDLRREYEAVQKAYAQVPNELNRMRLALVLSTPASAFKDERRALELLEPMAKSARTEHTPLRAFALVVQAFVRDQVKLGNSAQALKEKLDALMSLEKTLAERERASGGTR